MKVVKLWTKKVMIYDFMSFTSMLLLNWNYYKITQTNRKPDWNDYIIIH
jgi:hypothetical protein